MFHTIQQGNLEYLTADALAGSLHCFSTRFGGVSEGALASLNLGIHRGDRPENVYENYRILGSAVGFRPEDTVFTRQQHTDIVRRVGREHRGEGLLRAQDTVCDAQITDEAGVALVAFTADCTPILLFDPVRRAVGAVHAGWRGTALGIAARTVAAMQREYGCKPENIRAAIGPCIGACCFETDADVPEAMRRTVGDEAERCITRQGEKYLVDNRGINAIWLRRAGVSIIDQSDACTMCQPERFWSHRVTRGLRGSLAAIIMLPEQEKPL